MRIRLKYIHKRSVVRGNATHVYYSYRRRKNGTVVFSKDLPRTPNTGEFLEAWKQADLEYVSLKDKRVQSGTFGSLITAYQSSPDFEGLAPRTKKDYITIIDFLKPMASQPISAITTPSLVKLRDHTAQVRNFTFVNHTLNLISKIFNVGKLRGLVQNNPAQGIPKLKRPRDKAPPNRPWLDHELEAFLDASPPHIKAAIALGAYTGLREADVLKFPWSARDGGEIRQGKTTNPVWIPEHSELKKILDSVPVLGPVVVVNTQGKTYGISGFYSAFAEIRKKLFKVGKVGKGLTFHGLRHTVATKLADAGASTRVIQSITGHATPQQVETYVATANKKRLAKRGIALIDQNKV